MDVVDTVVIGAGQAGIAVSALLSQRGITLDERGLPIHDAGVSPVPGLYFVGFPWLSKRKSGLLLGVSEDAHRIVDEITARQVCST